jgi:FixJ family two-component response regulator
LAGKNEEAVILRSATSIFLVDGEFRRRAAISHCLAGSAIHVEPFEDSAELITRWPRSGLLLVHDDGAAIGQLLAQMGQSGQWLPVIGYAEAPATRQVVQAVLDGAIDYIAWPFTREEITEVVTEAEAKAESLGSAKLREALARSRVDRLTRREREVLQGVAGGMSNRLIGEKLSISPRTVEIHRANMLTKMGANHTSEAIRIAIEAALVD